MVIDRAAEMPPFFVDVTGMTVYSIGMRVYSIDMMVYSSGMTVKIPPF
ncbi:MAG: hypothetical protein LBF79_03450 [Dysgonamonadaceae bacterium]|jgi:hypothetical protein|nr:hypothetical protein [Dysgonamonadaceae bacterium]